MTAVKKPMAIACFFPTFAAHQPTLSLMFERLRKKWKVNGLQLLLILCTFAIGGSLTGFVAKKIMNLLAIGPDWLWAVIYIILVTLIWPLAVVIVSIPFGQFRFFKAYIQKMGQKLGMVKSRESGVGSQESESERY